MSEHRPKILIVDDVSSNIHMLMNILKEHYTLTAATNAKRALEILEKSIPDVILLDIVMPDMDGYEFCHSFLTSKILFPIEKKNKILPFMPLEETVKNKERFLSMFQQIKN